VSNMGIQHKFCIYKQQNIDIFYAKIQCIHDNHFDNRFVQSMMSYICYTTRYKILIRNDPHSYDHGIGERLCIMGRSRITGVGQGLLGLVKVDAGSDLTHYFAENMSNGRTFC